MIKRVFDLVVASISLLILAPFLAIMVSLVKLGSKGPVFYKQLRVGLNGKPFYIYKFRTMEVGADREGLQITSASDLRLTRVGRVLRKIKLDEMPQLFNVLKGEMSLVGPRPEVLQYVELYTDEQKRVLTVKPGMTDPATVYFRNEEEMLARAEDKESFYVNEIMPIKLRLYLQYIEKMSLLYDIKLIFLEILALILPQPVFRKVFHAKRYLKRDRYFLPSTERAKRLNECYYAAEWRPRLWGKVIYDTFSRLGWENLKGKDVLEIGFGRGRMAVLFAKYGCNYLGYDIVPSQKEEAEVTADAAGVKNLVKFEIGDFFELNGEYDLVFTKSVLFSIKDEETYLIWLRKINDLLNPNGKFVAIENGRGIALNQLWRKMNKKSWVNNLLFSSYVESLFKCVFATVDVEYFYVFSHLFSPLRLSNLFSVLESLIVRPSADTCLIASLICTKKD